MSRWVLVALVAAASVLIWVMATWPLPPEVETPEQAAADEPAQPAPAAEPSPPPAAAAEPGPSVAEPEVAQPAAAIAEPQPAESAEAEAEKIFTRENGPVAEYKALFDKEPRDSAASDAEQLVRGAFELKDAPKPVFRSVLCRETICKIDTRVSHESLGGYVAAMTRMVHGKFGTQLASERTSLAEAGEVSVTVYAKRPPPAE